jgi:hypothetical protein
MLERVRGVRLHILDEVDAAPRAVADDAAHAVAEEVAAGDLPLGWRNGGAHDATSAPIRRDTPDGTGSIHARGSDGYEANEARNVMLRKVLFARTGRARSLSDSDRIEGNEMGKIREENAPHSRIMRRKGKKSVRSVSTI